ncbi:response regulator transcription factor [Paenibacillus cremeus]|uniref:Response regulator transcription factor n=1 Tax=Paenibacillus cremeus TaxID=2163881 RepID=A0A559KC50_9BACL|nr:response regulator transcription factor [Paenibacillus cremeus]TVY09697.1 response regulator transcription factor [Paenibacillus cremeus]
MRILLMEDDEKLGMLIQYKLSQEFHNVEWVRDSETAEQYIQVGSYDAYILDWMVPGKSGVELCADLRAKGDRTPILMLTARDAVPDRVKGLRSGADDYLVKPFAFEELSARVHAMSRRGAAEWSDDVLRLGDDVLVLNRDTHDVVRSGSVLSLTRREFQLLALLLQYSGQVISRERIMDQIWGMDAEVTPNSVDATIKLLRKKVDDPFPDKLIHSVRGFGYRLSLGE